MNKITNVTERSFAYLQSKINSGEFTDIDTKNKFNSGELEIVESEIYARRYFKNGQTGIIQLVDTSQNREVGITTLENGRLPKNEYHVFSSIRFDYSLYSVATPALTDISSRKYSSNSYKVDGTDLIPAEILNSKLTMTVGGKEIFSKTISELTLKGRDINENGAASYELLIPRLVRAESDIAINIQLPTGVVLSGTSNDHHFIGIYAQTVATKARTR